jgi:hypothetical protein
MTGDYDFKMLTPVTGSHNPERVLLEGFYDIILRMLLYDTEDVYDIMLRMFML